MSRNIIAEVGQEVIALPGFSWLPVTRAVAAHLMLKMGHDNKTIDAMVFGYAKRLNVEPVSYTDALAEIPAECLANA